MAWTATLVKKARIDGISYAGVRYDNSNSSFRETYSTRTPSAEWLRLIVVTRIAELTTPTFNPALGLIDLTPPTPPTPPTPTQAELDRAAFNAKLLLLQKKKIYVDLGIIPESELDTLQSELLTLGQTVGEF